MKIYPSIFDFINTAHIEIQDIISIFNNNVLYPFSYKFNQNSPYLIIFLPGAFDRTKSMPKFQRANYFSQLEDFNCISFFDPTLFQSNNDFSIAWFQGNKDNFYINGLTDTIHTICSHLSIKNENILFFGTSAGGIPCLHLANNFLGCNVFAGNIQTNALLFYKSHVDRMLSICYPGKSLEEVNDQYINRVSVNHIDSDFNLFYAQNLYDDFHYKTFFLPFMETRKKIRGEYVTYSHTLSGHNPLPKEIEISAIKSIFSNHSVQKIYKNIK